MPLSATLDRLHAQARANRWLGYFAVFNRLVLAVGFLIAGIVKILGERFAAGLSENHPMGQYLAALHHTGSYYPFIGLAQVAAALLLLLPRTATLGAVLYFPIILNICVLSFAVRFEGSLVSSPLMLLANLYLLAWGYDQLRGILPWAEQPATPAVVPDRGLRQTFPVRFFAGVAAAVALVALLPRLYEIMPRNSFADCQRQFLGTRRTRAGSQFCTCIHRQGQPLAAALARYAAAPDDGAP